MPGHLNGLFVPAVSHLAVCFNKNPNAWGSALRGEVGICNVFTHRQSATQQIDTGNEQANKIYTGIQQANKMYTQAFNKPSKFTHSSQKPNKLTHRQSTTKNKIPTGSQQPKKFAYR